MKIPDFDWPVCNKFTPKFLNGQLCYQVDVNEVKNQVDAKEAMKHGLLIAMDYNEDKMLIENIADVSGLSPRVSYDTLSKKDKTVKRYEYKISTCDYI